MAIIVLLLTGVFVGIISSFFGVGGGILTVPVLYFLYPSLPPQTVIGSSLALIFLNAIINTINFNKIGKMAHKKLLIPMTIGMSLGAIFGGNIASILPPKEIKLIFAGIVLLVAIRTLFSKKQDHSNESFGKNGFKNSDYLKSGITTLLAGIVAGVTGLGGGAVMVPLFIILLRMPFKDISYYSNILMGVGSFFGIVTYIYLGRNTLIELAPWPSFLQLGYLHIGVILTLFIGSGLSSRFGVHMGEKIHPKVTQRLFAALLIFVSLKIFFTA